MRHLDAREKIVLGSTAAVTVLAIGLLGWMTSENIDSMARNEAMRIELQQSRATLEAITGTRTPSPTITESSSTPIATSVLPIKAPALPNRAPIVRKGIPVPELGRLEIATSFPNEFQKSRPAAVPDPSEAGVELTWEDAQGNIVVSQMTPNWDISLPVYRTAFPVTSALGELVKIRQVGPEQLPIYQWDAAPEIDDQ